jgi:hypothetical protein
MIKQLAGMVVVLLCLAWAPAHSSAGSGKGLKPFANDQEFSELMEKWKRKTAQRREVAAKAMPPPPAPAMAAPVAEAKSMASTAGTAQSITNVQTQGVDEGDIVKQQGGYLIVLRRGRLFTIRIGGDTLEPVSTVNAYAPDVDPSGTWYDEMLVADRTIVVIGYSYARGGTEIGLFDLDARGQIAYRATYHMRSDDYYSSRNYASRLIGRQLIFYSPLYLDLYAPDPFAGFPALRRWHEGATPADFRRILPANRIYRSAANFNIDEGAVLHTVSICDLDAPTMECRSTAVLGPAGRVF